MGATAGGMGDGAAEVAPVARRRQRSSSPLGGGRGGDGRVAAAAAALESVTMSAAAAALESATASAARAEAARARRLSGGPRAATARAPSPSGVGGDGRCDAGGAKPPPPTASVPAPLPAADTGAAAGTAATERQRSPPATANGDAKGVGHHDRPPPAIPPPSDAPPPAGVDGTAAPFLRPPTGGAAADEVHAADAAPASASTTADGGNGAAAVAPDKNANKKKAPSKYLLIFPESAEAALRGLDDDGIRRVQARQSRPLYALAMVLTTLTAVETALAVPGALFALGYDGAASWLTASLVCLGILSQLPKKLIWRRRPWMSGRAVGLRRDSTSSFPSRAVVCAVVFPIVSLRAYAAEAAYRSAAAPFVTLGSGVLAPWRQAELAASAAVAAAREASTTGAARVWPLRLLWRLTPYGGPSLLHAFSSASLVWSFVLLTAWSRVHVGAHYPSDAGAGALFGALISSIGAWAHGLWGRSGCATASGACYYASHAVSLTADTVWARLPYRGLGVAIAISYAVTLASFKGFWVKCSYVYGLLFSCVTLRWVLLCPVGGTPASPAVALPPLPVQTASAHATVVAVFGTLLAFGMATRGLRGVFRLVNFTVTYFGSLVFIIAWRLRHAAPEMGGPSLGAVAEAVLRQGTAA